MGRGTTNYRAPELIERMVEDPYSADIYSAGVMLFTLRNGYLPYRENL